MYGCFAQQRAEYSGDAPRRPIAGYSVMLTVYAVGFAGVAGIARITHRPAPRMGSGDLALMAITTCKISRALAKDPVTSPIRMPFTRFEDVTAASELHEEVRASGMEHAVGELVSCPFCLSSWVASGLLAGYTFSPGTTRAVMTTCTAVAGSGFLQYAYTTAQQRSMPAEKR
ncbi:hypothetical protein FHX42_001458 [Saccharopolyspora lacisalsi]|uniref:DUF1360 domain-containing protein n=1 Tax=Halosaccharopolyspora lacisalsi TaxID=1000566 RepID=A0A839DTP5_9PSEU|nr:DUF1360 domain-containing protein [Halosaccharopolyspora lacisalsi]MBA8824129.1 hypothetical protein [Halosaccharopolyspora lacisalsi]